MMAHDPFARTGLYIHLDDHLYRYRRVFYPLFCSVLSLGFPRALPAVMLGVNLLSVLVLTRALSLLLARRGLSPWWALSVGLYFGMLQGVFFCLTDPLALCLVCLALAARERGRRLLSVLILSAAVLTRETALVLVAVLFLFDGHRPIRSRKNLFYLLPPLVFIAWQAYLTLVFGRWPLFHGPPILGAPFAGLFANLALFLQGSLRGSLPFLLFDSLYKLLVACVFLFSIACVSRRRSVYGVMLLFHASLAMLFNNEMWGNPEGYGRVMSGIFLYLLLVWAEGRSRFGLCLVYWGIALSALFYLRLLLRAFG